MLRTSRRRTRSERSKRLACRRLNDSKASSNSKGFDNIASEGEPPDLASSSISSNYRSSDGEIVPTKKLRVKASRRRTRSERTKRRARYQSHDSVHSSDSKEFFNHPLDRTPSVLTSSSNSSSNESYKENNFEVCNKVSRSNVVSNVSSRSKDHLYKILVIGDGGTGKTSIIKRYVHRFFTQHYRSTIGVDFALKVLNWDENTHIRLQLWDIAGQERYGNMTRVYYKEAVGAFVVFDVTRTHTFDSVVNWKTDLDSKVTLSNNQPVPCVLLANKCDQPKEGLVTNPQKMDEYCKEKGFSAWFETSAKDNINIDEAARALVQRILENDAINNSAPQKDEDKINLGKKSNTKNYAKKFCSC